MPEPIEAVQGAQNEQGATAPAAQPDKQTTVKTSETSGPSVMDLLDIPPEVQQRVAPKAEPKAEKQAETPEPEPETQAEPQEEEGEEEEEVEEKVAADTAAATEKIDKREKRINRLTRQKAELEAKLDAVAAENHKLRTAQQKEEPGNHPAPLVGGNLPAIQQELATIDATLEWCDNNAEGGEIGEGDKTQYFDAKAIRAWRRDAELKRQKFVVAEQKELERLAGVREQADQQAISLWPEMFDKSKPEYQEAVAIIRQYPFITSIPEANYALGMMIEGSRSLKTKATKKGQPQKQHRDIDERVFSTPRVPIAPHTPEPPTRESTPSSQKQLNEAMSSLVKDSDGSTESVAAVFAAQDKRAKRELRVDARPDLTRESCSLKQGRAVVIS
jgi:hypothetical protein